MRRTLLLHPDSRCAAVHRIQVAADRPHPGTLTLDYVATGAIADVQAPRAVPSRRADELWRRTCFEVFLRPGAAAAYLEGNFAPSTEWALYRFSGYRAGMQSAETIPSPRIAVQADATRLTLQVELDLTALPEIAAAATWHVGLSAVIEERNGNVSYWALRHPPGKADFHSADGFVLALSVEKS
jgi:hypothetical protein